MSNITDYIMGFNRAREFFFENAEAGYQEIISGVNETVVTAEKINVKFSNEEMI